MKVKEIALDLIDNDGQLIRDTPEDDSIGELAESIASKGLFQFPGVRATPAGRFNLLWGDRRCRAARRLGWEAITCRIFEDNETPQKALALIENLQRRQLELSEEVKGVRELVESEKLSVEAVAAMLNKSRSWVLSRIAVPNLPEYIQEPLLAGDLKLGQVEEICRVSDDGARRYLTAQTIQGRWNKSQIRQMADQVILNPAVEPARQVGDAVHNGTVEIKPLMVQTACCNSLHPLESTVLVRVCVNGLGCQQTSDRADTPNS